MAGGKTVRGARPPSVAHVRWGLLLLLPSSLTLTRLFITYLLCVQLLAGGWGLPLFSLACLTDVFDGWVARRLHAETRLGALLDASVDFVLVFAASSFLVWRQLASPWFLGLIVLAFLRFVLAGPGRGGDPLGKHIGTVLFVSLGVVLAAPAPFVSAWSTAIASCYVVASMGLSTAEMLREDG